MSLPLICLHGAIGASSQLKPLHEKFSALHPPRRIYLFDFTGHGGKPLPAAFSIKLFAEDLLQWMDEKNIILNAAVGYSMGGYVALYIARHYPERVEKIMTVATKLAWDVPTSQKEVKMLDPQKIKDKVPKFAEALQHRHAPEKWEDVLAKTADMMLSLGAKPELAEEDFKSVTHDVQLCVGDRDTMVSIEETLAAYRLLPKGSFVVLPLTPHPIEQMNADLLTETARRFFSSKS